MGFLVEIEEAGPFLSSLGFSSAYATPPLVSDSALEGSSTSAPSRGATTFGRNEESRNGDPHGDWVRDDAIHHPSIHTIHD